MNILAKLWIASESSLPFKLAWKRLTHEDAGHSFDNSVLIESFVSEKHPHTCHDHVFTVNIRRCDDCGMIFYDNGLERR
ncbi:hypothetical protein KAR91_62275 [Candidatus Pacearchaeota archaeon]|nr:hypothetical protein [Candidatus Pacearchaeota archaeon]